MPTNTEARKARERRLRARYRKKTAVTAIVALLIGLILGFVLCAVSVKKTGPISRMLRVGPIDAQTSAPTTVAPEPVDAADSDFGAVEDAGDEDFAADEDFGAEEEVLSDVDEAFASEGDFADDEDFAPEEDAALAGEDEDLAPEEDFGAEEDVADNADFANIAEGFATEEDVDVVEAASAAVITPEPSEEPAATVEPTSTAVVTPEPTAEPTPTPTAEPTAAPTQAPQIIPFGQPMVVQTEVNLDGTKRTEAGDQPYEALSFTIKVDAYKNPAYFQENYATQYKLNGDEAAVEFDISLNGYSGTQQIIPQDVLLITFMGETPNVVDEGYQLMDAEIAGKTGIVVTPNTTTTLYKRYSYSAAIGDMRYMVVTTYFNGQPISYWFDIKEPEPVETPVPEGKEGEESSGDGEDAADVDGLTIGSEGEEVSRLQRALINKGLLQGSPDGKFGKYTADAVKEMQKRYDMEQTGVATQAFLDRLYADQ